MKKLLALFFFLASPLSASVIINPGLTSGLNLSTATFTGSATNYVQNSSNTALVGQACFLATGTINNLTSNTRITASGNGILLNGLSTTEFGTVGSTFTVDTTNGKVGIRSASPGSTGASLQIGGSTLDGQISLGGTVTHNFSLRSSGATGFANNAWGKYTGGADNDIVYVKATTLGGASVLKIGLTGNQALPLAFYAANGGIAVDTQLNQVQYLKFSVDDSSTNVFGSTFAALSLRPGVAVGNTWNTWAIQASSYAISTNVQVPTLSIINTSTNTLLTFTSTSTRSYGLVTVDTFTIVSSSMSINTSTGAIKARVGGCIFSQFTSSPNATTVETDLYINTIASNTLATNGDNLHAVYGLNLIGSGTATRQIKVYVGSTTVFDSTAFTVAANQDAKVSVHIVRSGVNTLHCIVDLDAQGASTTLFIQQIDMGIDLTANVNLKISGTAAGVGAATSDIVAKLGSGYWYPVP